MTHVNDMTSKERSTFRLGQLADLTAAGLRGDEKFILQTIEGACHASCQELLVCAIGLLVGNVKESLA